MNPISNIWNHPKTSAAGVLIAVVTVASVLSQQGITLGKVGTGSVITLVCGLATALLGLLARDPVSSVPSTGNPTAKLGAWALIALLLQMPFVSGCSGTTVAQDIVNWTPALQSAVATIDSTAALLAPEDAPIFIAATAGFDDASNLLVAQAKAYLANPSASVLAQLQSAVVTFQQQVNASLLQAAKITNANSQQHVLNAINAVATVVTAMLALVSSISSKSAVAWMASQSTIKLADVQPYINEDKAVAMVAGHYGEPVVLARVQVAQLELSAAQAGF
jgi:CheY-like chemotaxis protein